MYQLHIGTPISFAKSYKTFSIAIIASPSQKSGYGPFPMLRLGPTRFLTHATPMLRLIEQASSKKHFLL